MQIGNDEDSLFIEEKIIFVICVCYLWLKSIGLSDFSIDREDNRETWSGSASRYSACYERWTDGGRRGAESTCCNETRRAFAIAFLDVTSAPLPPPPTHTFL